MARTSTAVLIEVLSGSISGVIQRFARRRAVEGSGGCAATLPIGCVPCGAGAESSMFAVNC